MTPLIHYSSHVPYYGSPGNWFCDWWHEASWKCLTVIVCFISFVPMTVICVVQALTYEELNISARKFKSSSNRLCTTRQVFRTFLIVAAVFFFLTTPLCVLELLDFWVLGEFDIKSDVKFDLYKSFVLLMAMNSCANSLIYGRVHKRFYQLITCNVMNRRFDRSNDLTLRSTTTCSSQVSTKFVPNQRTASSVAPLQRITVS